MSSTDTTQATVESRRGKAAIVSGSSSGTGAAVARELSRRGAHFVINYPLSSEESAAKVVQKSLEGSGHSLVVEADLSTIEGPKKLAGAAAEAFGDRMDILVNNASQSALCRTSSSDAEIARTWDMVVTLNGPGTMLPTRAVLPFLTSPGSRIVNIGSSTSRDPDPDMTVYAGTKGMVESFTRC